MLVPNIVVAAFSFNDPKGKYNYNFNEFSTEAWTNPCGAQGICESLGLSLQIGVTASLVATVLGTMIAFALGRYRFKGRSGTNLLIFMPMATPEVVMGSSLLTLFLALGVPSGQGANPTQTFLRVTLPLAAPGIAAGALLAFSLSFDDYIITNFNASPSSITFPMYVWGAAQRGTPVQINVIGTIMFILSVGIVLTAQAVSARRAKAAA